jgi:hypothetical protein
MFRSLGSSVSIVPDYSLDERGSIPYKGRGFSSSSEAHSASYPVRTGSNFPGVKRGRAVTLTTHPI